MIRTLEALVLHKQWLGDTSAKVTFFTKESGLLHGYYKGGRSPKKQALLQAFSPLWLAVNERYDKTYIHALESRDCALDLTGDALFSGLYVNELLYYTQSPMTPELELFEAYLLVLNGLKNSRDRHSMESLLRRFEWRLLKASGYCFSLTMEAGTSNPIQPETQYQFIAGVGLKSFAKGIPGTHILALAEDNLNEVPVLKSAKIIMRLAIDHLLGGREIKARSLYRI